MQQPLENKSEELPPTVDSLGHHIRQANCQTYVWKQATLSMLCHAFCVSMLCHAVPFCAMLPPPDGSGLKLEEDRSVPVLISKYSAPKSIIELRTYHCSQSGCAWNCSCEVNSLSCTEACMCMADENCHNPWNQQASGILRTGSFKVI